MYKGKKVSLVIPAKNEQRLIGPTLDNVPREIDKIYVIDDGSTDKMADVVRDRIKSDSRIQLIQHERNMGVGAGIITGYKASSKDGYDIAVVIGGDNQMDLKDLPNFLDPIIENKADYTKGNRFLYAGGVPQEMPWKRLLGNGLLSFMTKIASGYYHVFDTMDGYTALTKKAIDKINWGHAWKGYGYPADFLIVFNAYRLRVMDVPRRAIYLKGERQSQIKIIRYVLKVSPLLMKKFFWRIWRKYIIGDFHPLVLFYMMALFLLPLGLGIGIWFTINSFIFDVKSSVNWVTLSALFIITGFQALIFAMMFESEQNKQLQNA